MRCAALLLALTIGACQHTPRAAVGHLVNPALLPLEVVAGSLAWCKLQPGAPVPARLTAGAPLAVVTYAPEGTFVVLGDSEAAAIPACIERGLRAVRLVPTDNPIVGTIATITAELARVHIGVEVVTTAETDYFLIAGGDLPLAIATLRDAGHTVSPM